MVARTRKRVYNERVRRSPNYWKPKGYEHYKTLKELAVAVGKDPSWLRRLEARGTIPNPPRIKRGQLMIRLYSPEIEAEITEILSTIKPGPKRQGEYNG